ncbi:MAG: DUF262 domain-containing protein [Flavobacterium sp.]
MKVAQVALFKNKNMHYKYSTITIRELIALAVSEKIILSPSYQRGFIWSLPDQKALIRTISKGFPLPNLFLRVLKDGKMEMVDGQQRSRTIIKYHKGQIKIASSDNINVPDNDIFLNYELPIVYIHDTNDDEIREIYYFINKKGLILNDPERQKAYYSETKFLKLAEELANNQLLINLDLFTDKSISRLNDRDFVQELIGYLYMYNKDIANNPSYEFAGIRDKKIYIEKEMFPNDITENEYLLLKNSFESIIKKFTIWDNIFPLNKTRYKQKNDFYTMFCFLNKYNSLSEQILKTQYNILLKLNEKDSEDNQYIRPTNDDCTALKEYAINCVSQSNSKNAREERLSFWENVLLNTYSIDEIEKNSKLLNILTFFGKLYGDKKINLTKTGDYYLLNTELLK